MRFHDGMRLVLQDRDAVRWLGHTALAPEVFAEICRPYAGADMQHVKIPAVAKSKPITKEKLKTGEPICSGAKAFSST